MENKLVILSDNIDPWDKQPDEPQNLYVRFDYYRLLGPLRSIHKAYARYRKDIDGVDNVSGTSRHWHKAAEQWRWEERAQAWDESVREEKEERALSVFGEGLSLSHERVAKLKLIAQKLEDYILDPRTTRVSPHIIEQYRGLLDDIAKERGDRSNKVAITGPAGGPIVIETQWGRGGSASDAWKALPEPVEGTIVKEIIDNTITNGDKTE